MTWLRQRHWSVKGLLVLLVIAAALFGIWRWAVSAGSAATLDWVDARFPRERGAVLVATAKYGQDDSQRLELWKPAEGTPRGPLVVFIHGGGWYAGSPKDYRFVARSFAARGYNVALAGYRLVPEGRYPAMLEDSAAALAWLAANAPRMGVAADSVVLAGHSAGAYNAVMLTLDPRWLAAAGAPAGMVRGAIGLAGPYDFYPYTSDSARNAFGHVTPPQVAQPITHIRGDAPPLLLVHGTADTVVRVRNSRILDSAIRRAGGRSTLLELPDRSHAWTIMTLARPFDRDARMGEAIFRFLDELGAAPASATVQRPVP